MNNSENGFSSKLMKGFNSGRHPRRLVISSDADHEQNKRDEKKRAQYRRQYWQKYSKRIKRVFGSITPKQYENVSQRAKIHGNKVFEQIWAESIAYCEGRVLPTVELAEQQNFLVQELRRIGNNINQLAKLGHLQARSGEGLEAAPNDKIGMETLRQFKRLENAVLKFSDATDAHLKGAKRNQDQSENFSDDH